MAYEKQSFEDGQVLEAKHLNHMEDGIAEANKAIVSIGGAKKQINPEYLPKTSWNDLNDKPFYVAHIDMTTGKLSMTPDEILNIIHSGGAVLFGTTMTQIGVDTSEDGITAVYAFTIPILDIADGDAILLLNRMDFDPADGSILGVRTAMWSGGTVLA